MTQVEKRWGLGFRVQLLGFGVTRVQVFAALAMTQNEKRWLILT